MPWRVDWAARWAIHGITCEPAGKDHGAAGGSYDTIPICRLLGGTLLTKLSMVDSTEGNGVTCRSLVTIGLWKLYL